MLAGPLDGSWVQKLLGAVITDVSRPHTDFEPDDVASKLHLKCNTPLMINTTVDQEMSLNHSEDVRTKLGNILGFFSEKDQESSKPHHNQNSSAIQSGTCIGLVRKAFFYTQRTDLSLDGQQGTPIKSALPRD